MSHGSLFHVRANPIRWGILVLIALLYMIVFLEKANISVAAPAISKEYGINNAAMGLIFSGFVLAYTIGQLPSGWLADHFGPRRVICLLVPFWSLTTVLTGFASGFASLWGLRFITGLGASGTFPITARAMQPWYLPSERGSINGLTHACARLGTAIVPPVAVWLTISFGWRWVFYACGVVGLLWVAAFAHVYRNSPTEHPRIGAEELATLRDVPPLPSRRRQVPWRVILRSPNMLFIAMGFACYSYGGYFYVSWLPSYLVQYRHLSMAAMGIVASLPLLAGMAGDIVAGLYGDRILARTGRLTFSRRMVAVPGMVGAALFIIPAGMLDSAPLAMICMSVSLFFMEFLNAPSWAVAMDVGGAYSGTVGSLMNLGASIGGMFSPMVFGALSQNGHWIAPFIIQAAVLITGALIWLFLIDAERPMMRPSENEGLLAPAT